MGKGKSNELVVENRNVRRDCGLPPRDVPAPAGRRLLRAGGLRPRPLPRPSGRVLRAFLAQRMEYGRATQIAASVGQGMALLFGLLGLVWNPFLLFIALFVYMGAAEEAATVQAEIAFRGVPVRAAMMTRFATLSPADPLSRATGLLL